MDQIVISGIQPSGKLHLGNYLGAIENWIKLQDEYACYFFVADMHSVTENYEPKEKKQQISQGIKEAILSYTKEDYAESGKYDFTKCKRVYKITFHKDNEIATYDTETHIINFDPDLLQNKDYLKSQPLFLYFILVITDAFFQQINFCSFFRYLLIERINFINC